MELPALAPPAVSSDAQSETQKPDTGLICLVRLLQFHKIPADLSQLQHALSLSGPAPAQDIVRLAIKMGVKSKIVNLSLEKLPNLPLPAIIGLKNGEFAILGAIQGDVALIHEAASAPDKIDMAALKERFDGQVILMTTRADFSKPGKFDLSWFIPVLMKYRALLGEVLVASFLLQLFALSTPLIFQVVIDKVLVHRGLGTLDVLIIALLAVITFEVVLGGLRSYVFTHTTSRVDVELGAKLYRHVLSIPLAYFESRRVGETVARVRELDTVREFLTSSSVTLVIDFFFTFVFLGVMALYSLPLTGIVLVTVTAYVIIWVILTPHLRERIDERFARGAESQSFLVESISGIQTLKAQAVEPQMQARWEQLLAAFVRSGFAAARLNIVGGQAIQFVNKISTAILLYFGAKLVISGDLSVGELVAFNMLAGRVAEPVLRLAGLWQQFQEARVGIERLGEILNTPTEAEFKPSRAAMPHIKGAVQFDAVTFRYRPGGREAIRQFSLTINPGEVIGIVGPSGSGKSTLTKLLQRLYVPESGRITVDGLDLSMADPAWLRRQIGVVLQENLLFNRTVRENIALSDPGKPMSAVIEAAKLAGAHQFILELSEGYDTLIEERGTNLSGGQRQRLAIARALITNPRILILDEATSALDAESEMIIQNNMKDIIRGRTVLIIAHRLSAIRMATRIITVDQGLLTEMGTHDSLMKQKGRYHQLWTMQSGGMNDSPEAGAAS